MSFEYIEIKDKLCIPDCVEVHKRIFQLSDIDSFPATFFTMLIRKEHPLGIVIGCYKKEDSRKELIGLTVTVADLHDRSLYCVLVGVLPEYQNGRHGYLFAIKLREAALKRGLTKLYGIYDPLETNLGKLYSFIGGLTTRYINEPYTLDTMHSGVDKVLYEWQLNSEHVKKKLNKGKTMSIKDAIVQYSIVQDLYSDEPKFLVEIPNNYLKLRKTNTEEADQWRAKTRKILTEYLNKQQYIITDCISGRLNDIKKTYYLLSKELKNELFCKSDHSN